MIKSKSVTFRLPAELYEKVLARISQDPSKITLSGFLVRAAERALRPSRAAGSVPQNGVVVLKPCSARFVKANYGDLFLTKYGFSPLLSAKEAEAAKRISTIASRSEIRFLLEIYFQMPDAKLIKAKHSIVWLESNLNAVSAFAKAENIISREESIAKLDNLFRFKKIDPGPKPT